MSVATQPAERELRWYQGITRYMWMVLAIAALGWLFDTMDQNLFNLVRKRSLIDLLGDQVKDPQLLAAEVNRVGGYVTAAFLVGWSAGGFIFGMLGDRIGRTGTMILTILIYAAFTGLSGLVWSWQSYAFMRFMTGLGVGGEWAAGAAIVAEVFPERSRPMALGALQALSAVGNMMAATITLVLAGTTWRWAYFIGALPALLVFWIRRSVHEPERWRQAKEQAAVGKELGTIRELFRIPTLRRNTIAALMMAVAGQGALWGVAFWSPDLLSNVLSPLGASKVDIGRTSSVMYFFQQVGAMVGIYAFAGFSQHTNRRIAFLIWFVLAWMSIPAFFWGVAGASGIPLPGPIDTVLSMVSFSSTLSETARHTVHVSCVLALFMGFGTLGPFSGYTVYFPELFPTRLRATGCGLCYNGGRFLSAIAPLVVGSLSASFGSQPGAVAGGMPMAATVVTSIYIVGIIGALIGPETKGKPLPEEENQILITE